jgi:hypothetical protein
LGGRSLTVAAPKNRLPVRKRNVVSIRHERIKETAFEYAFLLMTLGLGG